MVNSWLILVGIMKKPSIVERFEISLRRKRFLIFETLLNGLDRPVRILDVGGVMDFWNIIGYERLGGIRVTLLNLFEQVSLPPHFRSHVGDARCLRAYNPDDFDVVLSNSVIGHVGSFSDQKRMADEIRRVGRKYFVQTPNHYFPIDWRTLIPFFHFLPAKQQAWWLSHFPIAHCGRISSYPRALAWTGAVRNLTGRELKILFPESLIVPERLLGFTKSLMAIKGFDNHFQSK